MQRDGATIAGSLHRSIEGRDAGLIPRVAHVQDEAHIVAFHFLPERLDHLWICAGEARSHHAETQAVAVLHEVERFGPSAARARAYRKPCRRAAQVEQLDEVFDDLRRFASTHGLTPSLSPPP